MAQATQLSPPEPLQGQNDNHGAWLLRRIWDRVNRNNEHFMGVIVGREGSGKSFTALKIADTVDPTFDVDRVIFDVSELLQELKDGNHEPGNFYVLDEAGVQFGVRTWQERGQVLANQALQLIRDHNLGLVFTLPRLSELDSQAQGRLQAFYELTEKVEGKYVAGKWKWMDPDRADNSGKIYKPFPRRRVNGVVKRITSIAFTPPDEEIVEPYTDKKRQFQEEFYEEVIDELSGGNDSEGEDDGPTIKELAENIDVDTIGQFVSIHNQNKQPYIDAALLRMEYELSQSDAKMLKSALERDFSTEDLQNHA